MTPIEKVLAKLEGPRPNGSGWSARCPAHEDRQPSLSISEGDDGRVLLNCHAGCGLEDIVAALELDLTDLFPREESSDERARRIVAAYDYTDEEGTLLFQAIRYTPKRFRQRRCDGHGGWTWNLNGTRRVIYQLPAVRAAIDTDRWVVVVEGEKDADRLAREQLCATTSPMGARSWRDDYAELLAGAKVAIIPDNDPSGHEYAESVARSLHGKAKTVRVVRLDVPPKGDVSDWLATGGTVTGLKKLIVDAPEWEPSATVTSSVDGVYLIRADQIVPEHVDYFDDGLIPLRVVTIVTGLDGVGKSTMLYTKAAAATKGQLPGAFAGKPVDVVIASSEDHPASVILPRLVAAGAEPKRVHIVKCLLDGLEGDIALPDNLAGLEAKVREVDARLLIVDPLVAHLPLSVDSHKAQHVRSVLAPLGHLAEDAHLAVAAVVHFNGAPSTDVRSRISGSKALRDASRSVLVCGVDPNNEARFVMVQDKHSFGPRSKVGYAYRLLAAEVELGDDLFKTSKLVWDGEIEIDSRGLLAGPEPPEAPKSAAAKGMLEDLLRDGRVLVETLKFEARCRNLGWRTVETAKTELGVIAEQERDPETGKVLPSTWRLPNAPLTGPQPTDRNGTSADRVDGPEPLPDTGSNRSTATGPQESPRLRTGAVSPPDLDSLDVDNREDLGAECSLSDDEAVAMFNATFDAEIEVSS